MKIIITLFVLAFFIIPLTSADSANLPPIKQGTTLPLVQYCANCTFINITSMTYPNGTTITLNYPTQLFGSDTYVNYSWTDTNQLGTYIYGTLGDPNGILISQPVSRDVTATGQTLTLSISLLYIALFFVSLLFFAGLLIAGLYIPSSNNVDEMTGYVIAVSNAKYLKIIAWGFAYLALISMTYFSYIISYSFLSMEFLTTILLFTFRLETILILPGFILLIYILIANAVRDHKLGEQISQGLRIRDD